MNEEEMRSRILEIDQERNKLKLEKEEYEKYFNNKEKLQTLDRRKYYIGKCFILNNIESNKNTKKYIKAFKIIDVLENDAVCIAIIDGYRKGFIYDYGVEITTIGVWCPTRFKIFWDETDDLMIDFYDNVSQEEFEALYRKYSNRIEDGIFK